MQYRNMLNETKTKTSTAFVAAVDDVIRQNGRLREVVAPHKSVKITGPNGKRLYALGDLENDCVLHPGGLEWRVKLKQIEPCPVRELPSIEVWVEDSKQPIFREKDNRVMCAWDNKLPFLVGLIQPGYLRIGMQIEGDPHGKKAKRAGGLFTIFNVHRFQRGFMLPEEKIASTKRFEFSSLVLPLDRSETDANNSAHASIIGSSTPAA